MTEIKSVQDLRVWHAGMDLAEACYRLTRSFPKDELYGGLTTQIRRASVSIPANIAEGYGRDARGDYLRFLAIARGSLRELETHCQIAERVGLATTEAIRPVLAQCDTVGRMLHGLIRSVEAGGSQGSGNRQPAARGAVASGAAADIREPPADDL